MKKELQRIDIILRHSDNIKDFLSDITEEEWDKNKEKQCAAMYSLMAISENVKELLKLDSRIIARNEDIPWNSIARFRDKMSHHYDTVDTSVIFRICKKNIPPLQNAILQEKKRFLSQDMGR